MNILKSFLKPEFVFRPIQIYRRFLYDRNSEKTATQLITLPWGLAIESNPEETIGSCIARQGLYDLTVSELLWRLCEPGSVALDVGANIGHMTSLMSLKVGSHGSVSCFEPHPEIYPRLKKNIERWRLKDCLGQIKLFNLGLSDQKGKALLYIPENFNQNQGTASLESSLPDAYASHEVELDRLDNLFSDEHVGVMKIDVEGHELSVLHGAVTLLEERRIRDIVFEDHLLPPTPVTDLLQRYNYEVFYVEKTFFGLNLCPVSSKYEISKGEAPTFLATLDPERAFNAVSSRGYQVLTKATCKS